MKAGKLKIVLDTDLRLCWLTVLRELAGHQRQRSIYKAYVFTAIIYVNVHYTLLLPKELMRP